MKRLLSGLISLSILLSMCSCAKKTTNSDASSSVQDGTASATAEMTPSSDSSASLEPSGSESATVQNLDYADTYSDPDTANDFTSVRDEDLLTYMEDVVYYDLVDDLDSSDYFVESVNAIYVSQEYIEESVYNSQENIFFGYHLSDIQEAFGETPWFFTVDETGQTVVTEYTYKEFEFEFMGMLKDLAIGTGVILFCVTVSLVSAPAAPALSMIMMVAAKDATVFALSSGAIGAASSGIITYVQTGDVDQSLQAAMDGGGKGYKIGAITGAVMGAGKEIMFLRQATTTKYLTMNEAALIQRETKWPADVIAQIHTMDEYQALANANLKTMLVGNQTALVPSDVQFTEENIQRMLNGNAPLDIYGNPYELHHIGQEADATLAMLTQAQHDNIALHGFKTISEIDRNAFAKQRSEFYKNLASYLMKGT